MVAVGSHVAVSVAEATGRSVEMARSQAEIRPTWALAFAGGRHDPSAAFAHLRRALDGIPIYGGTAPGVVTREALGYSGYEVAVALFDGPRPRAESVHGLDASEYDVGRQLGRQLRGGSHEWPILLLYDSVRSHPPPVLNVGSYLVDGLYEELPPGGHIWGAGVLADLELTRSTLFDGQSAVKQAAVALVLEGYRVETMVMHGCEPLSAPMRITEVDGPVIRRIDGRRALDVVLETTGLTMEEARQYLGSWVTLGAHHGSPDRQHSEDLESSYVNRLVLGFSEDEGSLRLFEADFREGDLVQVMHRDNPSMVRSAELRARRLAERRPPEAELFMYVDCAGRCQAFSGADVEEADVVRRQLPPDIPLLGFYSVVEIAPTNGRSRPLDWTGVLSVMSRV